MIENHISPTFMSLKIERFARGGSVDHEFKLIRITDFVKIGQITPCNFLLKHRNCGYFVISSTDQDFIPNIFGFAKHFKD